MACKLVALVKRKKNVDAAEHNKQVRDAEEIRYWNGVQLEQAVGFVCVFFLGIKLERDFGVYRTLTKLLRCALSSSIEDFRGPCSPSFSFASSMNTAIFFFFIDCLAKIIKKLTRRKIVPSSLVVWVWNCEYWFLVVFCKFDVRLAHRDCRSARACRLLSRTCWCASVCWFVELNLNSKFAKLNKNPDFTWKFSLSCWMNIFLFFFFFDDLKTA